MPKSRCHTDSTTASERRAKPAVLAARAEPFEAVPLPCEPSPATWRPSLLESSAHGHFGVATIGQTVTSLRNFIPVLDSAGAHLLSDLYVCERPPPRSESTSYFSRPLARKKHQSCKGKSFATVRSSWQAPVTGWLPGDPPSSAMAASWSAMTVSQRRSGGRDRTLSARSDGWGRPCRGARSSFGQGSFVAGPGPRLPVAGTHDSSGLACLSRNGTSTQLIDQAGRSVEFHGSNFDSRLRYRVNPIGQRCGATQ